MKMLLAGMHEVMEMAQEDSSNQVYRAEVTIAGERYVLKSEKPPEYISAVAHLVDEQMSDILRKKPNLPRHQAAILAALNIANRVKQLEQERAELLAMMEEVQD